MKQRSIPREIHLGDSIWKVKFVRKIPDEAEDTLGLCDPSECTIYIKQGQSYVSRLDTLFHEIIHAIENEYEFDLDHKHVYKLGEALAKFFVDNF